MKFFSDTIATSYIKVASKLLLKRYESYTLGANDHWEYNFWHAFETIKIMLTRPSVISSNLLSIYWCSLFCSHSFSTFDDIQSAEHIGKTINLQKFTKPHNAHFGPSNLTIGLKPPVAKILYEWCAPKPNIHSWFTYYLWNMFLSNVWNSFAARSFGYFLSIRINTCVTNSCLRHNSLFTKIVDVSFHNPFPFLVGIFVCVYFIPFVFHLWERGCSP